MTDVPLQSNDGLIITEHRAKLAGRGREGVGEIKEQQWQSLMEEEYLNP
jgi:hypothetical protein